LVNKGFSVGASSQLGYDLNNLIELFGVNSIYKSNLLHYDPNIEGMTLILDVNTLNIDGISNLISANIFEFEQLNPFTINNQLEIGHNIKKIK